MCVCSRSLNWLTRLLNALIRVAIFTQQQTVCLSHYTGVPLVHCVERVTFNFVGYINVVQSLFHVNMCLNNYSRLYLHMFLPGC